MTVRKAVGFDSRPEAEVRMTAAKRRQEDKCC